MQLTIELTDGDCRVATSINANDDLAPIVSQLKKALAVLATKQSARDRVISRITAKASKPVLIAKIQRLANVPLVEIFNMAFEAGVLGRKITVSDADAVELNRVVAWLENHMMPVS